MRCEKYSFKKWNFDLLNYPIYTTFVSLTASSALYLLLPIDTDAYCNLPHVSPITYVFNQTWKDKYTTQFTYAKSS